MNKSISLIVIASALFAPACALGKISDAAEALEEAEKKIGELAISECMDTCAGKAQECFDSANGECIDLCEKENDACLLETDNCLDAANSSCSAYHDSQYYNCMDIADNACFKDCDGKMSDCGQACGNELNKCLFAETNVTTTQEAYSECVSDCVGELEDTLQEIEF
jgi:hypothetical protein